jgi:hypothetical protein
MRAKLFVEEGETTNAALEQAAEKLVPASLTVDNKNSAPLS